MVAGIWLLGAGHQHLLLAGGWLLASGHWLLAAAC
jgi:hypothetical protein